MHSKLIHSYTHLLENVTTRISCVCLFVVQSVHVVAKLSLW